MTNLPAQITTLTEKGSEAISEWTDTVRIMETVCSEFGEIDSETKLTDAADRAKEVHLFIKEVEEARKQATGPLDAMKKQIMDVVRPIVTEAEGIKGIWKSKITVYQRKQRQEAEERERRQREEAERQARLAEEAAATGDEIGFEHHAQRAEDAEFTADALKNVAPKTTAPSFGRATATGRYVFEVEDESLVPREYLTVNEQALKQLAKIKPKPPAIPGIRWRWIDSTRIL